MFVKLNRLVRCSHREEGFTLIELVVVIGILGVLAVIAVPRYMGYIDEARVNADAWIERAVTSALEIYKETNGDYPATAGFNSAMGDFFTSWPPDTNGTLSYSYDPAEDDTYTLSIS